MNKADKAVWQQLHDISEPLLEELGLELVELIYRREQGGWMVRLIIWKPEGIGIDDCSRVSRELSTILDVEDIIEQHYTLEVSSPGLTRPLTSGRDFERNLGKEIKLTLDQGEYITCQGKIISVANDTVELDCDGEPLSFSTSEVKKAKLII